MCHMQIPPILLSTVRKGKIVTTILMTSVRVSVRDEYHICYEAVKAVWTLASFAFISGKLEILFRSHIDSLSPWPFKDW